MAIPFARAGLAGLVCSIQVLGAVSAAARPPLVPDVAIALAGLPAGVAQDEEVLEYAPGGWALSGALPAIPNEAGIQALTFDGSDVLFTPDVTVEIAGVTVEPRDIARWNGASIVLEVDGSASGIPDGLGIDALAFSIATGNLLISVDSSARVGPIDVDDEDLFRPSPSPLLVFDGSAEGIDPALDLVGFGMRTAEEGIFTFDGSGRVDDIDFDDEDLLLWSFTSGDFGLYLDASSLDPAFVAVDVQAVPEPSFGSTTFVGLWALLVVCRARRCTPS